MFALFPTHAASPALDSFDIPANIPRRAALKRVVVWSTSDNYALWRVSFECEAQGQSLTWVQLAVRLNEYYVRAVQFGPPIDRATTVAFAGALQAASTTTARSIFITNIIPGTTLQDIIGVMRRNIPGYQLLPQQNGTQGWAKRVIESLEGPSYLPPASTTQMMGAINRLRQSSTTISNQIGLPLSFGEVIFG